MNLRSCFGQFHVQDIFRRYQNLLGFAILVIISIIVSPINRKTGVNVFLSFQNIANVAESVTEVGIMAIGMTFVILSGGIDLSVGSVLALSGVLVAGCLTGQDWFGNHVFPQGTGVTVSILLALLFSGLAGLASGLTITKLRIPPFVATLAMMSVARGIAYLDSGNMNIRLNYADGSVPICFRWISGDFGQWHVRDPLGIVPVSPIILIVVAIVSIIVLKRTRFGRYVYAIGGGEEAARLSGIQVARCVIVTYVICALLSGLAGIIHASELEMGKADQGLGYELDAIAAVVIGGASLMGGVGTVAGTLIGAVIMGVLKNILGLRGIDPFLQMVMKGVIIIGAVLLQRSKR